MVERTRLSWGRLWWLWAELMESRRTSANGGAWNAENINPGTSTDPKIIYTMMVFVCVSGMCVSDMYV